MGGGRREGALACGSAAFHHQSPSHRAQGDLMRFKNKVALITAGGNGIGRATAKIMVSEGATVIVADNHQGHLDEAVPSLKEAAGKSGGKVQGALVDALDPAQVEKLVA